VEAASPRTGAPALRLSHRQRRGGRPAKDGAALVKASRSSERAGDNYTQDLPRLCENVNGCRPVWYAGRRFRDPGPGRRAVLEGRLVCGVRRVHQLTQRRAHGRRQHGTGVAQFVEVQERAGSKSCRRFDQRCGPKHRGQLQECAADSEGCRRPPAETPRGCRLTVRREVKTLERKGC